METFKNNITQKKRSFSPQEDQRLIDLVNLFGISNWKVISQNFPGRTQRQCRERYKTYLAPGISKDPWTPEEDELLKQKFDEYGPKWSVISKYFIGRTDNNLKNRYNNHISDRKKRTKYQFNISEKNEHSIQHLSEKKKDMFSLPPITVFDQFLTGLHL